MCWAAGALATREAETGGPGAGVAVRPSVAAAVASSRVPSAPRVAAQSRESSRTTGPMASTAVPTLASTTTRVATESITTAVPSTGVSTCPESTG